MDNEQETIETMICYLIEANKTITDSKDKLLRNYITAVRKQLETKDKYKIKDSINTMKFNKYFNNTTDKWNKINRKQIVNYAALIFNRLLNYYTITEEDIIKNTKFITDKYNKEDDFKVLDDSYSLLFNM